MEGLKSTRPVNAPAMAPVDLPPLDEPSPDLRRSLRIITLAWLFGAAWLYLTTGAVLTRYAALLGTSPFGFGLLAAIPYAGALFQLPASFHIEKHGGRKTLFMITGLLGRGLWLVVALLPLIMPRETWPWMLLLVLGASTAFANLSIPPWMTWMADLVPNRVRGRYFSRRGQYGRVVAVIVSLMIAALLDLDRADGVLARLLDFKLSPIMVRHIICLAFALAGVLGMVDIALFRSVPDHERVKKDPDLHIFEILLQPLRDRNFLWLLGYSATLNFAIGYVGQFLWLYAFDVVGLTSLRATAMITAVPLMASMLTFPLWGRLIDRIGSRAVLLIAGLCIVHGGASWILITPEHWVIGWMGSISATLAWPGVELATFHLLLGFSATRDRQDHKGSAYIAVHSLAVALAGVLSGIFAGCVAELLHDWRGSILGWPLSYHGILMLISAALRLAAVAFVLPLRDPKRH